VFRYGILNLSLTAIPFSVGFGSSNGICVEEIGAYSILVNSGLRFLWLIRYPPWWVVRRSMALRRLAGLLVQSRTNLRQLEGEAISSRISQRKGQN